jgi:D-threitol dehydrogenase (NAD+)
LGTWQALDEGLDMASEVDYEFSLAGKVAVVTGGASGIGAAIGDACAVKGATVVVLVLAVDAAQGKVSVGSAAAAFACDVTNEQSLIDVIDAVNRQFGRIDVLVNSAGIAVTDTAEQLAVRDWDQTMAINLRGAFLVSQQIGRIMLAQGSGTVISLAPQAATIALPGHLAYCASKAGLVGMTKPVTSSVSEDTFATTRSAGSAQRSRMNRQASTTCVG